MIVVYINSLIDSVSIELGDVYNDFDGFDNDKDKLTAHLYACALDVQSVYNGSELAFKLNVSFVRSDDQRVSLPYESVVNLTVVEPNLVMELHAKPK